MISPRLWFRSLRRRAAQWLIGDELRILQSEIRSIKDRQAARALAQAKDTEKIKAEMAELREYCMKLAAGAKALPDPKKKKLGASWVKFKAAAEAEQAQEK